MGKIAAFDHVGKSEAVLTPSVSTCRQTVVNLRNLGNHGKTKPYAKYKRKR